MNPAVLAALGLGAAGCLVWFDRIASAVVRPTPRLPERSMSESGLAHEDVLIPGPGYALAGWILPAGREAPSEGPVVLMAHGWGANYGTVLRLAEPLVRAGHDVLLFDMRGHGRNAAVPYVTVRHLRDDVTAVVAYAERRFPARRIVLLGHSLGGAASVLAAAEGARVSGLVLIATPANVLRITAEVLSQRGYPGPLMVTALRPFWWWRLRGTFRPHSVERRIRELDVPLLILHPENDARVRREHAQLLSEAAGEPYHLIRGREHTDVLSAPEVSILVNDFLGRVGRSPSP